MKKITLILSLVVTGIVLAGCSPESSSNSSSTTTNNPPAMSPTTPSSPAMTNGAASTNQ